MSVKYLGQPFDIHCGGIDHIPVHHINEIAQNEAANDKKLANYWLHGEFLIIGKEKMAKSGENFITIATIKEKNINPVAYRYFVLQAHYRKQLNFTWEALQAAEKGWERLRQSVMNLNNEREKETDATKKYFIKFVDCLNNDLNTAEALALTWKILDDKKITAGEKILLIKKIDKVLDLDLFRITPTEPLPPEILDIVNERNQARAEKNWQLSDKLRKILEQKGYEIKDSKEGTTYEVN